MGYIRKSLQVINKILDEETELPKNWDKFIKDECKSENILIKKKNKQLYCTNCQKEYKYIRKPKKCHFCHQELEVKGANLKRLEYKKHLILVNYINDEWVFRLFELKSIYDSGYWSRSCIEYGRHFMYENTDIIKDNVCTAMGSFYVSHGNTKYSKFEWRAVDSYWKRLNMNGKVYPYNLKDIYKGTKYQYSQIWELAKHVDWINIKEIMQSVSFYSSFELLVKAKLYNLSKYSQNYNKKGSFEDRFGIPKDFLPFMQKHNITEKELDRLKILKQKNIQKVRYLTNYSVDVLEGIKEYMNIDKFITYSKKIKNFDEYTYRDYLRFSSELGFNMKDKQVLFPRTKKELEKKHNELEKQYEIRKDELLNKKIKKRYKELIKNTYKDGQFIVKPAATIDELIDEGKQQNNCVRTYAEDYANKICDIYFMRNKKTPNKSLVTIEVRNNKVVQSRTKNNQLPNKTEVEFLEKWELKIK